MKYISYLKFFPLFIVSCSLSAQLLIEDFERYLDTNALHADVFSFGTAAQAGKPSLAEGLGENNSKAACFTLTWDAGNNANICFLRLSPNAQNLSGYTEISSYVYIEDYPGMSPVGATPTIVKLAIEGRDGTIWQTRSVKAERPPVDSVYKLRFRLLPNDMERVEGSGQLRDVISSVKNIRLRFENTQMPGFRQDAYIDSIEAVR